MIFLITFGQPRPNILTDIKDEKYHGQWARYCVGQANNFLHTEYVNKIKLNKAFYKNRQWILDEDTEAFLKDDTNQSRNRIALKNNIIQPLVEQYRGNAIRMNINAKVKAVSPQAANRRNTQLNETLLMSKIANQPGNPFGEQMKKRMPIGNNEHETERIFDNLWTDTYVRDMNHLMTYVSELNRFPSHQPRVAEEICFSGLGVMKAYEYGGNLLFDIIESENFWWDRSNKLYDLSDCEFMGDIHYLVPSEIFEKNPNIDKEVKDAIEKFSRMYSKVGASVTGTNSTSSQLNKYELGGRVPVFNSYWKDGEEFEYGYVADQFGYPYFTRVNYTYHGEHEPRYTTKDLIKVDSDKAKRILKGKLSKKIFREVIRYCSFVPKEILVSATDTHNDDKFYDVILDYGALPWQETDNIDYIRAKFPFKAYAWGYVDGETISPIDVAIDPQRFINRILSIAENQINNSGGVNITYDKSMTDAQDGEDNITRNVHQSKAIGINAKGRGIQNAIGSYDATVKSGTIALLGIVETMKKLNQDSTGVNDALQGNQQEGDPLVGVTQLMIQRGSLIQEPFYNAIREIFLQNFQCISSVGKKIYCDNERELAVAVGDDGAHVFKITKDMKLEDFAAFVKFENTDEALAAASNQELIFLKQNGLIDDKRVAYLWGRSSPDGVASAMMAFQKEKEEMARMTNQAQSQQQQQMQQAMEAQIADQKKQQYEAVARQDIDNFTKHKQNIESIYAKALGKIAENNPLAQNQIISSNLKMNNQRPV